MTIPLTVCFAPSSSFALVANCNVWYRKGIAEKRKKEQKKEQQTAASTTTTTKSLGFSGC